VLSAAGSAEARGFAFSALAQLIMRAPELVKVRKAVEKLG
jgi:hypothetical protein